MGTPTPQELALQAEVRRGGSASPTSNKGANAMKGKWGNEIFNRLHVSEYPFQGIPRGTRDSP